MTKYLEGSKTEFCVGLIGAISVQNVPNYKLIG